MRDSRGKASARWGYAAVCQPLPAGIYDEKHITRTLYKTITRKTMFSASEGFAQKFFER